MALKINTTPVEATFKTNNLTNIVQNTKLNNEKTNNSQIIELPVSISSFEKNDPLRRYTDATKNSSYAGNFSSTPSLVGKLKSLVESRKNAGLDPAELKNIFFNMHGNAKGIFIGNDFLSVESFVSKLYKTGIIKEGSKLHFDACQVGQNFTELQRTALKYKITITAPNDLSNKIFKMSKPTQIFLNIFGKYEQGDKIPSNPGWMVYHPNGAATENGITVTGIKYPFEEVRPTPSSSIKR
jgi:hypothetical protein